MATRGKMSNPVSHKFPYLVTVLEHSPHFDDTGHNTRVIASDQIMYGFDARNVREQAEAFVNPLVDPSTIEYIVEKIG
jgi:hypothetical protein